MINCNLFCITKMLIFRHHFISQPCPDVYFVVFWTHSSESSDHFDFKTYAILLIILTSFFNSLRYGTGACGGITRFCLKLDLSWNSLKWRIVTNLGDPYVYFSILSGRKCTHALTYALTHVEIMKFSILNLFNKWP